jgi:hypothetical protein
MDSAMTDSVALMCSSCAMVLSAGAMIVLTMMRLKPVADSTSVTAHLRLRVQSLGLSMSKWGSKATRKGSEVLVVRLLLVVFVVISMSRPVDGMGVIASAGRVNGFAVMMKL